MGSNVGFCVCPTLFSGAMGNACSCLGAGPAPNSEQSLSSAPKLAVRHSDKYLADRAIGKTAVADDTQQSAGQTIPAVHAGVTSEQQTTQPEVAEADSADASQETPVGNAGKQVCPEQHSDIYVYLTVVSRHQHACHLGQRSQHIFCDTG